MIHKLIASTILACVACAASPALAQIPIPGLYAATIPTTNAPVLGNVVRGTSDTTFSISTNGVVTRPSGNAVRLTAGPATPPVISVTCVGVVLCLLADTRITITATGGSHEAKITKFRVGNLTNASFRNAAPVDASSMVFDLQPFGYGTATFTLGMDVLLPAGATPALETYTYTVTATRP